MKKVLKISQLLLITLTLCIATYILPSFALQKQQAASLIQTDPGDNLQTENSDVSAEYTQQIIEQITSDKFDKKTFSIDANQLTDTVTIAVTDSHDYFVICDNKIWGQYAIAEPTGQPNAYRQYIWINGKVFKVSGKALKSLVKDSRINYQAGLTTQADKLMNSVAKQASPISITYFKQSHKLRSSSSSVYVEKSESTEQDNTLYRVPGGGLTAHEAAGGHLIAQHVAKTEKQLLNRVADGQVKTASSFTDITTAEKIVSLAIEANQTKIQQYLSSNERSYLVIEYHANYVIGISVTRGKNGSIKVHNARIILAKDPRMPVGYKIITGYPVP